MNDLKYRVEELELDGDDLRRRVDKLTKEVEYCEANLPDIDDLAEKDDLERLEFRVDRLEGDDFVDPDDFDDLERRVRKLEKADWNAWLERKGTGDSAADPETTALIDPDDVDALARRVKELENADLRTRLEALELETSALRDRLAKLEGGAK